MPVQENYKYADEAHEKTRITGDYRYGCHSDKTGRRKRSDVQESLAQNGWKIAELVRDADEFADLFCAVFNPYKSEWLPINCGHNLRVTDPACTGCFNRHEGE